MWEIFGIVGVVEAVSVPPRGGGRLRASAWWRPSPCLCEVLFGNF